MVASVAVAAAALEEELEEKALKRYLNKCLPEEMEVVALALLAAALEMVMAVPVVFEDNRKNQICFQRANPRLQDWADRNFPTGTASTCG